MVGHQHGDPICCWCSRPTARGLFLLVPRGAGRLSSVLPTCAVTLSFPDIRVSPCLHNLPCSFTVQKYPSYTAAQVNAAMVAAAKSGETLAAWPMLGSFSKVCDHVCRCVGEASSVPQTHLLTTRYTCHGVCAGSVINPGTGSPNLLLQIEASVCACDDSNAATLGVCSMIP